MFGASEDQDVGPHGHQLMVLYPRPFTHDSVFRMYDRHASGYLRSKDKLVIDPVGSVRGRIHDTGSTPEAESRVP